MAVVLVATVGGAESNAYADRDEAVAVAETLGAPGAAFIALENEQQEAALIATAMDIDAVRFRGIRATTTQAMEHPRIGEDYVSTEIHRNIKRANILEAIARSASFATGATTDPLNPVPATNGNVKRKAIGPIETEYFAPGTVATGSLDRFSLVVRSLLEPLMYVARGAWGSAAVTRSS